MDGESCRVDRAFEIDIESEARGFFRIPVVVELNSVDVVSPRPNTGVGEDMIYLAMELYGPLEEPDQFMPFCDIGLMECELRRAHGALWRLLQVSANYRCTKRDKQLDC